MITKMKIHAAASVIESLVVTFDALQVTLFLNSKLMTWLHDLLSVFYAAIGSRTLSFVRPF